MRHFFVTTAGLSILLPFSAPKKKTKSLASADISSLLGGLMGGMGR